MRKILATGLTVLVLCAFAGCCQSHEYVETARMDASCDADGSITYKCANCDQEDKTVLPAVGHSFTEEILQEASCTAAGAMKRTCSACGAIEEEEIPILAHDYNTTITKDPAKDGYVTETGECTVCGDKMNKTYYASQFKKGTVVITIDDGNADDIRVYEEILSKYNIPATFYIITSKIDGETNLTKDQLRTIYNDPNMEIANHGYSHKNDDGDITLGTANLRDWLGITENTIGFASPGSQMKNDAIAQNEAHLKELGLLYVRTSESTKMNRRHLELQVKLQGEGTSSYIIKNIPQLSYGFDSMCVNSAVAYHSTNVEDLKKLVDIAAEEKACVVFMFHRIKKQGEPNYEDQWCYDYDKFAEFVGYLAQKRDEGMIDTLTTRQAFLAGSSNGQ